MRITERFHLAKLLFDLRQNPALRDYLIKNIKTLAEERCWFNTTRRIRNIYAKLVNE